MFLENPSLVKSHPLTDRSGFTLLETMIAMAIMVVAFAAILMVESGSIKTTERAREMNTVSMLAKNAMIQAEFDTESKTFEEIKKEESGTFPEPYQDYSWTRKIKEIEFPNINMNPSQKQDSKDSDSGSSDVATDMITKLVTQHLSKAIREINVTISWKRGSGVQSYTVSTYWVDLNHEFQVQ